MPFENESRQAIDLTPQARAMVEGEGPTSNPEAWSQPSGLFGPGRPVLPVYPEEEPRIFEYPSGINLYQIPRAGFGLAPFWMLRNLAACCKEVRLNIELIKREIRALEWEIVPTKERDPKAALYAPEIEAVTRFLESPDGIHDFDQWLNILLEELLVIDAPTIWPELSTDGSLIALECIAGDTIRPLLDFRGRIAPPPLPAYTQVLHGLPTSYFQRDRLIYKPFNSSASSPYGTSPIEFILLAVNLMLRRDTFHLGEFTEGNVPEALVGAPSSWSTEQVKTWQTYWDAMVAGNMAALRRLHWVPLESGRGQVPVYEFRKDDITDTSRDEWLMRVACWAYGNSPTEFGITPGAGLGGVGFAESMENIQYRSILGPMTQYLQRLITQQIIRDLLKKPWLKFMFTGLDPEKDQLQMAQIDDIYTRLGVYDVRYIQDRLGIPPELRPNGPPAMPGGNPYGVFPAVKPVSLSSPAPEGLPPGTTAPLVVTTERNGVVSGGSSVTPNGAASEVAAKFFRGKSRSWDGYG